MLSAKFLTLFSTFDGLDVVRKTLPSVLEESARHGAKVLVHDCSIKERDAKWAYLQQLHQEHDFHLQLSSPMSLGRSRNLCLSLGMELFMPEVICAIDDDHGYNEGFIPAMLDAVHTFYNQPAPNGLHFGLFTGCKTHYWQENGSLPEGHLYVSPDAPPFQIGRANNCCRCAPALHWLYVLKGWDVDEYPVSNYQCRNLNWRNYHRGFASMLVGGGRHMFDLDRAGRGTTWPEDQRLWDNTYTASDRRAVFRRS